MLLASFVMMFEFVRICADSASEIMCEGCQGQGGASEFIFTVLVGKPKIVKALVEKLVDVVLRVCLVVPASV